MPTRKSAAAPEPAFEQDLERLEELVNEMETGQLPLEQLMKQFEEGMTLVRRCGKRLAEVERKVERLLNQTSEGEPQTEPFEPDPPATDR
ncbi:MAG: exodeoxyribonuclease VII small subunit [Kiritimatiellae bacterium]|nr:exodeoxyribonuclease VII small subunit [Kiritimatiellia bacterium]